MYIFVSFADLYIMHTL